MKTMVSKPKAVSAIKWIWISKGSYIMY